MTETRANAERRSMQTALSIKKMALKKIALDISKYDAIIST